MAAIEFPPREEKGKTQLVTIFLSVGKISKSQEDHAEGEAQCTVANHARVTKIFILVRIGNCNITP